MADAGRLSDEQFVPSMTGNIRFVVDYPFDENHNRFPTWDWQRFQKLKETVTAPTLVRLPDFLSDQRKAQLGQLVKFNRP
ncbi:MULTISPECIES: hypothetical protein [Streptomyces]|uniref:Uncharacterized protein n=1 Tax=Streptomyces chartreusis NRRL 3882 TaxID=1079985 RepID=A0A2N9BEA6_STRCX|nr:MULTISPECIES: hypothetical protein [Streptomyces]SOR81689.1 hypothetical protein SCNRRL3882_5141 [Streptomyces chartreusis NRRL 3882]